MRDASPEALASQAQIDLILAQKFIQAIVGGIVADDEQGNQVFCETAFLACLANDVAAVAIDPFQFLQLFQGDQRHRQLGRAGGVEIAVVVQSETVLAE